MGTRSVRIGGWELSLSRPARIRSHRTAGPDDSILEFIEPVPQPNIARRDPQQATAFVTTAQERGAEHARATGWQDDSELSDRVSSIPWYHTIELPDGRRTPGQFDHRALVPHYGMPHRLDGKRALDVATFDGFWAFEMERRGATVTAIDIESNADLDFPTRARSIVDAVPQHAPTGRGFALAHELLGSSVKRVISSVYDLSPDRHGSYDFVHCGDLLLHLREPLRALEAIRSVTAGEFLLSDVVDLHSPRGTFGPTVQYLGGWADVVWSIPSLDALGQMLEDAGFTDVKVNTVYSLTKTYEDRGLWRASITAKA